MKTEAGRARAVTVTLKGRGAADNRRGRFERQGREAFDDGWVREREEARAPHTEGALTQARSIILPRRVFQFDTDLRSWL